MTESSRSLPSARTFYDEIGGHATFTRLVARFYAGVRTDPVLVPLYPQDDWDGAEARFRGATTVDGLGMLLHQARPSFEAWFGVLPEVDDRLRALVLAA